MQIYEFYDPVYDPAEAFTPIKLMTTAVLLKGKPWPGVS